MASYPYAQLVDALGSTTARALIALLNEQASVDDSDAVGDGVADDTAAIAAALAAAGPGGTVVFTAGKTYKTTSQIPIPYDGMTLLGYGAVITSGTDSQFRKFLFSGRTRGAVRGLRFECLYTSASTGLSQAVVEVLNSSKIDVEDCEFNAVAKCGVYIYGTAAGCSVINCEFYQNFCAIFSDDDTTNQPTYLTIMGNAIRSGIGGTATAFSGAMKFSGAGNANSHAGHVITGNTILSPGQVGIELQTWVNGCAINDNVINGPAFGISFSGVANCGATGNALKNISGTASFGIEVTTSDRIALTGNTIDGTNSSGTSTTGIGISLDQTTNTRISGGTISGCTAAAVYAQNPTVKDFGITGVQFHGGGTSADIIRIKSATNFVISGCEFYQGAGCYDWICLDTTDAAVAYGVIDGNLFVGTTANCGLQFYIPGSNAIQSILITSNNTANSSVGGGGIINVSAGSITNVKNVRCTGNIGNGSAQTFNFDYFGTSSNFSFPWGYFFLERGTVGIDASGGARTLELPDATLLRGYVLSVVKTDSSGNTVTVNRLTSSGQTINGASSAVLSAQYKRVTVESDGANWFITQSN